jgi:hypothetical protein
LKNFGEQGGLAAALTQSITESDSQVYNKIVKNQQTFIFPTKAATTT